MSRPLPYLLAPALFLCLGANAQQKTQSYRFPLQGKVASLNQQQARLADSLYNYLVEGESLQLNLLSETEEKLEPAQRSQITYERASLLLAHYRKMGLPERGYVAEMVPYQMPNVVRTHDLTRASSVSIGRRAQTHIRLTKNIIRSTANAAATFDADFSREMQQFNFNAANGITATLSSGTTIVIPPNSLQQTNGLAPDCQQLTLRVSEYLDLEAMALKAMSTTSSGKKLQTGGMWHIDVMCDGKPLVMKQGEHYNINVNMQGEVKNMKVFTGRLKNGMLDWKEETDDKVILPGQTLNEVYAESNNERDVKSETEEEENEQYLNNDNRWDQRGNIDSVEDAIFDNANQYGLQLNDFGWINCDAFDETQTLTDLMVYGEVNDATNVMLVYGKRKSVLPGYLCEDGKSVKFSSIAADETAMLVVFKKTDEKGGVTKFTRILQPGKDKNVSVSLTASTADNLRSEIKSRLSDL